MRRYFQKENNCLETFGYLALCEIIFALKRLLCFSKQVRKERVAEENVCLEKIKCKK